MMLAMAIKHAVHKDALRRLARKIDVLVLLVKAAATTLMSKACGAAYAKLRKTSGATRALYLTECMRRRCAAFRLLSTSLCDVS